METTFPGYDGCAEITFKCDDKKELDIFTKIVKWCQDRDCYDGETFMQSDDCLIDSDELMCEILDDVIKFDVKWKDD